MNACVALIFSTILLAVAATGGVNAYICFYFIVALILSGLRFTKAGSSSALLLMLISLNTMSLSATAEEKGLGFVASLWTESGVTNPNAVFRNTLIGMCWISFCISFARLIPPSRTVRSAHSRMLLPKVLRDLAAFIRLTIAHHIKDDVDEMNDSDRFQDDISNTSLESPLIQNGVDEKPESIDDMIIKVVHDASITSSPGLAELTALEPRIVRLFCQCNPPVNLVGLLSDLTNGVNDLIFSSLTLRAFSKAGFQELQIGGLKEVYEESADTLERCAESLETLKNSGIVADASDEDPEHINSTQFDPIRINDRAVRVENLANEYINVMLDGGQGSYFDKSARTMYIRSLRPWIMGAGFGLVAAIFGCFVKAFIPMTWKRIFMPPYHDLPKFVWVLKFALGFVALVCMVSSGMVSVCFYCS